MWTAWRLAAATRLGRPWFELLGFRVYYRRLLLVVVRLRRLCATGLCRRRLHCGVGDLRFAVAIGVSVGGRAKPKNVATYGSARWAGADEVRAAGLLGPDGVVLGKLDRDYLRRRAEHVLCFATHPIRQGCRSCRPFALAWAGSAIVDIKGENWQLTAGFRSRHGRVLLFSPPSPKVLSLQSAARGPARGMGGSRRQNVADVLVDPEGSLDKRNRWEKTSHSSWSAPALHVLYAGRTRPWPASPLLSIRSSRSKTTLGAMMTTRTLAGSAHPVVTSTARTPQQIQQRSASYPPPMSFLRLYRGSRRGTCRCDWRIADLIANGRDDDDALYLDGAAVGYFSQIKPLIRLVLNQIGRRLTEIYTPATVGIECLMMLDEFPALGRLDFFGSALSRLHGGVRHQELLDRAVAQPNRGWA